MDSNGSIPWLPGYHTGAHSGVGTEKEVQTYINPDQKQTPKTQLEVVLSLLVKFTEK